MSDSELMPADISDLVRLLRYRAEHQPDKTAYIFLKDGESEESRLTYRDLDRKARVIATELRSLGAVGERALLLYPPGLEYIAAFVGCLYAGVVAVPVYPPHPARLERSLPRLIGIAKNAKPFAALTLSSILTIVEQMFPHYPIFGKIRWLATDGPDSDPAFDWQYPDINGDTLAFLQYTSGSTGNPKGVMLSHANLLHNELLIHSALETTDRSVYVSWLPLYHDMGLIGCVLHSLYMGVPSVLMSPTVFLQSPFLWLRAISLYGATVSGAPNFAYDLCVRKITDEQRKSLDLSCWETAFNGSEPVRADTIERFSEAFAPCGFRREAFYPCYGLAEATLVVSGGRKTSMPVVRTFDAEAMERRRIVFADEESRLAQEKICRLVGSGKTIRDQRILIVNPDTLTQCQPDEIGEIWVSGKSMARGYWQMPEQTKETFQAYLVDTHEGPFLRTGDLGFLANGELFIAGRLKDLIIIRGRNHYPQDIELTAEKSYPLLRPGCSAAFMAMIDGEERLFVAAEVERRHTRHDKPNENRQYVELPEFVPPISQPLNTEDACGTIRKAVAEEHDLHVHGVLLLKVGSIPKTTSGKIQRHACKEGFLKKSLEIVGSSIQETVDVSADESRLDKKSLLAAPEKERRSLLESHLRHLISEIMKADLSHTDSGQPLINLGLDSLMAIELQHRLETGFDFVGNMSQFLHDLSITRLSENIMEHLSIDSVLPKRVAVSEDEHIPLSHNQQSLWFLHELAPNSAAYNVFFSVRITSELNVTALRRAFRQLVMRHPSLRTTYTSHNGKPVQHVNADPSEFFVETDASFQGEEEFGKCQAEESHRPFDLEKGPIFRVNLYKRSANEHILLLNVHHIAIDLWSFSILLDELRVLYSSDSPLPPLKASYHDFVRWQANILAGSDGAKLWAYWKNKLSGELPILNLPCDHRRPPVQTYEGASHPFRIGKDLTSKIRDMARDYKATMYMMLMSAFHVLLYRYTGQKDILVGSPAAGRSRAAFADIVGYFANPVVIRSDISGNPSFAMFLEQMRQTVLEALTYQDYPFQRLIAQLQPERDPGRSPLFQVMFVLEKPYRMEVSAPFVTKEAGARMNLGELTLESLATDHRIAQFDMTLMMVESEKEEGIRAEIEYNTDLFSRDRIERMAGHFQTLLEQIVSDPNLRISELSLLTEAEQRRLMTEFNDTAVEFPCDKTIPDLFEEQAARTPDNTAVIFEDAEISYRQLNERANQLAHFLREEYHIAPDDRIGVLLDRSEQIIMAMLGIMKAGGAYVPVDPSYPSERIRYMLEDSDCKVILTEETHSEMLSSMKIGTCFVNIRDSRHSENGNPRSLITSRRLAYVIYTSGSTGQPKGVMLEHRGFVNMVLSQIRLFGVGGADRFLQFSSCSFDASMYETFIALLSGAGLVCVGKAEIDDPDRLLRIMEKRGVSLAVLPPAYLRVIGFERLRGLRTLITAGENAVSDQGKFGDENHRYWNAYGPTEFSVCASCYPVPESETSFRSSIPIGKPISNAEILIMDDSGKYPKPIGVPGEICLAGVGLARGYLNRPELTAEKFVPHPFDPGERMYRTGDLGQWLPDGNIEFLGRNDDQVKIRGYRIETGEITNRLSQYRGVKDAVVIAKDFGRGYTELAAYVVSGESSEKTSNNDDLRDYLRQTLPEYMIPSYFVRLNNFPLTPNGKTDIRALPEVGSEESKSRSGDGFATPQTELERRIADIWKEILKTERIGTRDNFFDSGGDSLLLIGMRDRLREVFGQEISVVELFGYPTIRSLAAYLSQDRKEQTADVHVQTNIRHDAIRRQRETRLKHRGKNDE